MEKFSECKVWEKTDIIDLPYLPFDKEEEVKEKIINDSAKHIKKVKNVNFREIRSDESIQNERRFIFYHADTLIGLDISTLDASAFTYLDQFFFLMKMYPLVLINSYTVTRDSLKKIALHSYCSEHYYILPTFGPMPFLDKALSGDYYGEEIVKLFKGEVEKISISDFPVSIEELKIRFPQLKIENDEIFFEPQITWLGIIDNEIVNLLNYLFNKNIVKFNYKKECKNYSIDELKLLQYIEKSMLFYKMDDENVMFRMQRKNVYWNFICNLAAQFEREMIERDAICYDISIDEKIGTVRKIDEKIYHKLGNLFIKCDAFSYKMFSNIKRILDKSSFSEILVVDNGNMDSLISMLKRSGWWDHVYEVIDYYGVAVKFPTIDYKKLYDKEVLIIIDVINTGKLLKSVFDLLNKIKCKKIGVFSFIVNQDFSFKELLSTQTFEFYYMTEKKLNSIEKILDREYTKRFINDRDLNFKLLWGEVGKDIELKNHDKSIEVYLDEQINMLNFCAYKFSFNSEMDEHSYIYQKLKRLFREVKIICVLKTDSIEKNEIQKIVTKEYADKIKIVEIEEKDVVLSKVNSVYVDERVLFFMPNVFVISHKENMERYIKTNKIENAIFLDLVEFEVYSLDKYEVVNDNMQYNYVFQSKLKRFSGIKNHPDFKFLKDSLVVNE